MQFMLHPNEKEILLLSETCAHVTGGELMQIDKDGKTFHLCQGPGTVKDDGSS